MAVYHENLKYHEDDIEKHEITPDEIKFLIELQKEMNTQDNVGQASPRYWVIKGTEKEYGIEDGYQDGIELYDEDACETVAESVEDICKYFNDELLWEINECDGIKRRISVEHSPFKDLDTILIEWEEDGETERTVLDGAEEVAEWLDEQGYNYKAINYRTMAKIYEDAMFPTQKAAENHLKANAHHYSADAHTYAMTAWRCPEMTMLWNIIREIAWDKLIK